MRTPEKKLMGKNTKLEGWNAYLKKKESEGWSLERIKYHLVFEKNYDLIKVEAIIKNYQKIKDKKILVAEVAIVLLLATVVFIIKPSNLSFVISPMGESDTIGLANGQDILFIDINNPTCDDDYTRTQALSGTTPWCTLDSLNKIESGDTVYIRDGKYNDGYSVYDNSFTSNVTITAYPGDTPNITRYMESYATVPNALWSDQGDGLWRTTLPYSDTNFPRVYYQNTSKFFTWKTESKFLASTYPASTWYDSGSKHLFIKFADSTDPNQIPLYVSNQYSPLRIEDNSISNDAYIILSGLTFKYDIIGVDIRDQSNVIVENCILHGGHEGIKINNYYAHENLIFRYNHLDGKQNPVWYEQDMKDEATEETSGILVEGHMGPVYAYNNTFTHWHGGLTLATESSAECNGSEIYNNLFIHGRGSQIEIEKYCSNSVWHHNKVIDSEMGVSFAPADASGSENPCEFHHNIVVTAGSIRYRSTTTYKSYAIKAQYRVSESLPVENWDIHHNTFYAYGRAMNTMEDGTWVDTRFTDNIFYADLEYVLLRSGEASNDVFYDNNLYYSPPGGYNMFARWNDDSDTTQFNSLADALASDNWDGTWDLNSVEADPEFTDVSNNDMRPAEGSPACTMSTTGSYVGALPCVGEVENICGDNSVGGSEECELPSTNDNNNCSQSTSTCSGLMQGTRDAFGDCDASCGCVDDSFTYQCVEGQCGAECDSDDDCDDSNASTTDICENNCTCTNTPTQVCGDGNVDGIEECELPSTNDNNNCSQSTSTCSGLKQGTRDAFGDCDASCGCITDSFTYQCVEGQCGAECDSNDDCDDSNVFTLDTCESNCSCTHIGIAGCGNGIIDDNEMCELPNDSHNDYCNQSLSTCNGTLKGTRDGFGDCDASCQCVPNVFSYACEIGECGAECVVDEDCDDSNQYTTDRCTGCICENIATPYCGDGNCTENCSTCITDCGYCALESCTLFNKSWQEDFVLSNAYNLSDCFRDPNGFDLNFSATGNENVIINLSEDGIVTLSTPIDWYGEDSGIFIAEGVGTRTAYSNNISFHVSAVPDCNDSVCEGNEDCNNCPTDCGNCTLGCTLEDVSWNEDTAVDNAYNLTECFGLNTTFGASGNAFIMINITDGIADLSAPADWYGTEVVYFWVNSSLQSNTITLRVINTPDCGDRTCDSSETCTSCSADCGSCSSSSGGGGGGGSSVSSVQTLDITSDISAKEFRTVRLDFNGTLYNLRVTDIDLDSAEFTIGSQEFVMDIGDIELTIIDGQEYTVELLSTVSSTAELRIKEVVKEPMIETVEEVVNMENATESSNESPLTTAEIEAPSIQETTPTLEQPSHIQGILIDTKTHLFVAVLMTISIIVLLGTITRKVIHIKDTRNEIKTTKIINREALKKHRKAQFLKETTPKKPLKKRKTHKKKVRSSKK